MGPSSRFIDYMITGVPCSVSVGDLVIVAVGFSGLPQGFSERLASNPIAVMPVVDTFLNGNHDVVITRFIVVQILSVQGGGSNWSVTMQLLNMRAGMPIVTASGACGTTSNVVFSETQNSPTNNCNNLITRVWSVTNFCSSSASATQTITIVDTTPPTISCPSTVTVGTGAGQCTASNVNLGLPTVSDNCLGVPTVQNNAPIVFAKGTNFVVWTATDSCGNSTICTQQVIVIDNQPPLISCPGNILTNSTSPDGVVITFTPSATDNCDGTVPVNSTPVSGSTFPVGTTIVNCSAADSSSNSANCSFNVTVVDETNFRITSVVAQTNDVLLSWIMPQGFTGIVQTAAGDDSSNCSDIFSNIGAPIFVPGSLFILTNYTDAGGSTNAPSRYYRIRLVP